MCWVVWEIYLTAEDRIDLKKIHSQWFKPLAMEADPVAIGFISLNSDFEFLKILSSVSLCQNFQDKELLGKHFCYRIQD